MTAKVGKSQENVFGKLLTSNGVQFCTGRTK